VPPPAEVIDEKIESPPLVPATGAGVLPTPPAPTVIGKADAVTVNAEHDAAKGLAVYGVIGLFLPSLNPPAPPPPPISLDPPPPPATTI
jgi:hypothetical protein